MTSRSVLPYVRGIDLSETNTACSPRTGDGDHDDDASSSDLPSGVDRLVRLEWLYVNSAGLRVVPDRVGKLQRLEHLSVNRNSLTHLHGELCTVASLKSLHARHNCITAGGIPDTLFATADMQVVDLSHNRLRSFPTALEHSRSLMVLNLSHNEIEQIPVDLFVNCTDLMYLDLSYNALQQMPAQLRRCINLRKLVLSHNPEMGHSQLRSIMALKQLETLHLANTGRTLSNFPESLEKLSRLVDLDLSANDLPVVPDALYQLRSLRRLSLARNGLSSLDAMSNSWPQLDVLDVSENKLEQLPAAVCKLACLRKLYVSDNRLTFAGMPKSIGKLERLVVLNAANNLLENIPEGLCRCGQLRRLYLAGNRLLTLPDAIHYLRETLDVFDIADNPYLVLPPKPKEMQIGAGRAFYNLDFSLETHKKAALIKSGSPLSALEADGQRGGGGQQQQHRKADQAARWRRLKRRGRDSGSEPASGAGADSQMVLDGMRRVARAKQTQQFEAQPVKSRSWKDALQKPDLDYSEIFDELVGQIPGLEVWEIDDRYPRPVDDKDLVGVFFRGDCYIVLSTFQTQSGSLDWIIYYWIGSQATTDKLFCASMHAVNLRNLLGAECRTRREEEDAESPEFLALFGGSIQTVTGEHSNSGLFQVIEEQPPNRLYRLCGSQTVRLQAISLTPDELDPKFVYLLDAQSTLFVWVGASAKHMTASKARLIADRIRKTERKNAAEVVSTMEGFEPAEFWTALGCERPAEESAVDHIPADWEPSRPLLYAVRMGPGSLEIPRVRGQLTQSVLDSASVYLLDCGTDIYVWFGSRAQKFLRYAGLKLAQEAYALFDRLPQTTSVTRCLESAEPISFKLRFHGWDDAVAVDFTRTADSVQRRGVDMRAIMERDKMRMDLTDFFLPKPTPPTPEDALDEMLGYREDVGNLDKLANFVLVPNYGVARSAEKYKRIAPDELGHFYTKECYIFICHYYPEEEAKADDAAEGDNEEEEEEVQMRYVVYFWQGRDTSELALHKFNFDTRKTLAEKIKDPEFRPQRQQEESRQFLALLDRRFIIHRGQRPRTPEEAEQLRAAPVARLYQLRTPNADPLLSRCLEVPAEAASLCSAFCHLLTCGPDRLFLWLGRGAPEADRELARELAAALLPGVQPAELAEGEEPDEFWQLLGGRAAYFTGCDFYAACRLFKLTTEEGYLKAVDMGVDFSQAALTDSAIMLLDNGTKLYLWIGTKVSDVLKKLALQAAKLYLMAVKDREGAARRLGAAQKGSEPADFTACFHGWGEHKVVKDWRG